MVPTVKMKEKQKRRERGKERQRHRKREAKRRDRETERGRDKDREGGGRRGMREQRNPVNLRSMSKRGPQTWLLAQGADRPQIITKLSF